MKTPEEILDYHMHQMGKYTVGLHESDLYECAISAIKEALTIPVVRGGASECECKKEWLLHNIEYNVYPYGDNIEYDKCNECGKTHNFKTF